MLLTPRQLTALRAGVFTLCLLPLALMVWDGFNAGLGTNPIEEITHRTGDWTLRLLLLTLTVTPLRRLANMPQLLRLRRMLGLFTFFYACLHAITYFWLDQFFDFEGILRDVVKRPFITAGFTAFVLLIPLAATSTQAMMRRLGRHWQQLHRLVYVVAVVGVVHYWWLVKADVTDPAYYAGVLLLLLGYRAWFAVRRRAARAVTPRSDQASSKI